MQTNLTTLFTEFFESEQASGVILIVCTLAAIVIANSPFGKGFLDFWHLKVGFEIGEMHLQYSVEHWINDGLMALFFLLIGLEIERELYVGELSDVKNASLPIVAALGGRQYPPCSTSGSIGALQPREALAFPWRRTLRLPWECWRC
jgi:Na+:H+ antiporter, NhaA family